jgi:hypothetical protein
MNQVESRELKTLFISFTSKPTSCRGISFWKIKSKVLKNVRRWRWKLRKETKKKTLCSLISSWASSFELWIRSSLFKWKKKTDWFYFPLNEDSTSLLTSKWDFNFSFQNNIKLNGFFFLTLKWNGTSKGKVIYKILISKNISFFFSSKWCEMWMTMKCYAREENFSFFLHSTALCLQLFFLIKLNGSLNSLIRL